MSLHTNRVSGFQQLILPKHTDTLWLMNFLMTTAFIALMQGSGLRDKVFAVNNHTVWTLHTCTVWLVMHTMVHWFALVMSQLVKNFHALKLLESCYVLTSRHESPADNGVSGRLLLVHLKSWDSVPPRSRSLSVVHVNATNLGATR